MNFSTTNNSLMQDKIFLEDYVNIVSNCNTKCIKDYSQEYLTGKEQQCLEKCYFKTLSMNKALSNNWGDLMYQIRKADEN
jgi:hypothetical protein